MKVRVDFTCFLPDYVLAGWAVTHGHWPSRDEIKEWLKASALATSSQLADAWKDKTKEELLGVGVPKNVILNLPTVAPGNTTLS
jgi:hypothetical protein